MMNIPAKIIGTIVQRQVKKQAIRTAQRKVGINKAMGLVRRFDKRKTFVKNLKDKPLDLISKMFKQFFIRKVLGNIPPARFLLNWRRYGIKECMKRIVLKFTPTELKKPMYFIKGCKTQWERIKIISEGKKSFWEQFYALDNQKEQSKVMNAIIKFNPKDPDLRQYWDTVLDYPLRFWPNSPQTNNFEQHPASYNVTTKELEFWMRGYGEMQITKPYTFSSIEWEMIYKAMRGADFGRTIYSKIRSPYSLQLAKYWAMKDPHYRPKKKR